MNPKQFLTIGGVIVLVYGLVGFILPDTPLLGDRLLFTGAENVVHVLLGIAAVAAGYVLHPDWQRWVTATVGAVALVFFLVGLVVMSAPPLNLAPANVEVIDTLVHLVVGTWGLWAAFRPAPTVVAQPT
jgi:bacteriorhodopsin